MTPASPGLFDFLDECHQQMQQRLVALTGLAPAIAQDTLTPDDRALLRTLIDWFDTEARQHHRDEEAHVFPALLLSDNPLVAQTAQRLQQDHGWLEENWLEIAPSLSAAAGSYQWYDPPTLARSIEVFEQLYMDHLMLEESLAYPQARAHIDPTTLRHANQAMQERRAARAARLPRAAA